MKKLSVIFSFYNENEILLHSINRLEKSLTKIKRIDYEIIFVNDCSNDGSLEILLNYRNWLYFFMELRAIQSILVGAVQDFV